MAKVTRPGVNCAEVCNPQATFPVLAVQGLSMCGTGWYLVVLGQYRVVLVDT